MAENKGYMTLSDEQGSIHISEEVIAAIAVGAVRDVEGVSGMMTNLGGSVTDLVTKKNAQKGTKGVKIDMTGTALVPAAQEKAFSASCVQAEKVQTVRGRLLQGQGRVQVDYWMLEAPDGLCIKECGMVALTPELEPELIAAKLMLLECGMVQCTAAQKGAVQLVAKDVGVISDDSGKPTEDTDTHKVRADRYVM